MADSRHPVDGVLAIDQYARLVTPYLDTGNTLSDPKAWDSYYVTPIGVACADV